MNRRSDEANAGDGFLDYREIVLSGMETVQVDADSIAWGRRVMRGLDLEGLSDLHRAMRIRDYLSDNFSYNFGRSRSVGEIIRKKGGNCLSHSLMGIFLLRLAGIPAKFAHEVHIIKRYRPISLYVGFWAAQENNGINSFWHNDHVWVWFRNGDGWEPFDSALVVCGMEEFYGKRFFKQGASGEGFAQKWTGPPFIVWESVGEGLAGMRNVTPSVLSADSLMTIKYRDDLLELVDLFKNWDKEDLYREDLPEHLIRRIRTMSVKWFRR